MKHKRLWSRILVMALIMVIAVPATTLKAYAMTRTEIFYIWSEDWSQVTAKKCENKYDEVTWNWRDSSTLLASQTVNTVVSYDDDGNLVYTAKFTDPNFNDQSRKCRNSDDVILKWDFNSDPSSEGWICNTTQYNWWSEDGGRSGGSLYYFNNYNPHDSYQRTKGEKIISPEITIPQNAVLTFWAYGGDDYGKRCSVEVSCAGDVLFTAGVNKVSSGTETGYYKEDQPDYRQYAIDLSNYAGDTISLSFIFKSDENRYDGYIDDVELHATASIGWQQNSDGKMQYFDETGTPVTGWQEIDGKWYYFDKSGIMQTGWQQIGKKWYFFNDSGIMQTGWMKSGSKWYYLNPANGQMATGWKQISGSWYFFKASGVMAAKEWCKGYWLNANGTWTYKPKASWKKNSKGWWFGDTSGWYAKNQTIIIDGKNYTFDAAGYCVNP